MTRNVFIFLGTFVVGALIALVARAAMFNPHAGQSGHVASGGEYTSMVSNALVPAKSAGEKTGPSSPQVTPKPVNSVCAICGMDVDPTLPTELYQGKTIGFGCKLCAPKFRAEPDRYGPAYLRNEVLKK